MPAIHSKLTRQGEAKVRHQKLKRDLPDTHVHALLLSNFSSKCPRPTEANHQVRHVITESDTQFTSLRECRGRGRPRGGRDRSCGGRGIPQVPRATGKDGRGRAGHRSGGGSDGGDQRGAVGAAGGRRGGGDVNGRGRGGVGGRRGGGGGGRRGCPGRGGGRGRRHCGGGGGGHDDNDEDNGLPEYYSRRGFRLENIPKQPIQADNPPRITIGEMGNECQYCHALLFLDENLSLCCMNGNVQLPAKPPLPEKLLHLCQTGDENSRLFRQNIRLYNNHFSFASMPYNLQPPPGRGGFVFCICGQIGHQVGPLHPGPNEHWCYGQLHIYDANIDPQLLVESSNLSCVNTTHLQQLTGTCLRSN